MRGPNVSEELIAEALHPYPDHLVIATKGGFTRPGPGQWVPDGRPEHLREACEGSLKRLRVDRIDLYQLHRPDPQVPYEESVGALKELQDEGKIRLVGVSNVSVEQLDIARSLVSVASVQNGYNLAERAKRPGTFSTSIGYDSEEVLEACEGQGIAFIPYSPLAAGSLADSGGPVADLAQRYDATGAQIALAWLLARSEVMLPIPGTTSVEHLEENLAAAGIELTDDEIAELNEVAS